MNDIEVKRARVRALAWRLISNPPVDFNLQECTQCAIATACRMPEFELIGWGMKLNPRLSMLDDLYPSVDRLTGHEAIYKAAELLGLERWHVGYGHGAYGICNASAFDVGIMYLEAIGDCGPPERARADAPVVLEAVSA